MQISFDSVQIGTGLGAAVPTLSLDLTPGVPNVIAVETDERPLLVSMLLGGRLRPDSGRVLIDGRDDRDELRRRVALVDTPVVAEPSPGVGLIGVVAEELTFAGRPASRGAVRAFLEQHELLGYARVAMRSLPPGDRVRLFSELALLRPDVTGIVITSPERHGGSPSAWYSALAAIAERDITVAIVTDAVTATTLSALGAAVSIPENS